MASFGAKSPLAAIVSTESDSALPTYEPGFTIGKLNKCVITPNYAEGQLDADNTTAEYLNEITDEDIALDVDTLIIANSVRMYGAKLDGNDVVYAKSDVAPYMGYGFYHSEMRNGVVSHIGHFFPKVKASRSARTFDTRGKSISFGVTSIPMKVNYTNTGKIEFESEPFATEEAAYGWVASKLNVSSYFKINTQVQGGSSTKKVDKTGLVFVAAGSAFTLTITGTPTALYDNGADKVSSIANGVYTLASVSADHELTVIF